MIKSITYRIDLERIERLKKLYNVKSFQATIDKAIEDAEKLHIRKAKQRKELRDRFNRSK